MPTDLRLKVTTQPAITALRLCPLEPTPLRLRLLAAAWAWRFGYQTLVLGGPQSRTTRRLRPQTVLTAHARELSPTRTRFPTATMALAQARKLTPLLPRTALTAHVLETTPSRHPTATAARAQELKTTPCPARAPAAITARLYTAQDQLRQLDVLMPVELIRLWMAEHAALLPKHLPVLMEHALERRR